MLTEADIYAIIDIMNADYLPRFYEIMMAGFLGGLIGLEREHHGQAAGFRTNMIVCLGACLLMQLSLHIESTHLYLNSESIIRIDPGRIASYAVASMGFLGAGAILKGRNTIRGLTTAASLWLVTGIGLCVGNGVLFPATVVTFIIMGILYIFPVISGHIIKRNTYVRLTLEFAGIVDIVPVKNFIKASEDMEIQSTNHRRDLKEGTSTFIILITGKHTTCWQAFLDQISELKDLTKVYLEDAEVT